jgi:hypothetical protein
MPAGASSKEIRINGAKSIGVGFVNFALCIPIMLLLEANVAAKVMFFPAMLGYGFVLTGGYRLVFGKGSEPDPFDVFSFTRVLFGVAWILCVFGIPLFLLAYFR